MEPCRLTAPWANTTLPTALDYYLCARGRRLLRLIGGVLLLAVAAAATGCSETPPASPAESGPVPTATARAVATAAPRAAVQPAATPPPTPAASPTAVPVDIGSKRQLFVDDWLIADSSGTSLVLHSPRDAEVALRIDDPWEDRTAGYYTVFKDGDLYRMYYRCHNDSDETTCYAQSGDGIRWEKPSLGLFAHEGSKANNIVWSGPESHNFAAFVDTNPDRRPGEEYKALGGQPPIALVSPDGVNWRKLREEPVLTWGAFDSQNVAFWDEERGYYSAYFRIFSRSVRAIARSTSVNFTEWSSGVPIDLGDSPTEHLYTNATTPYFRAPHILLAFPMRFSPKRQRVADHPYPGVSDSVFMSSRDGMTFDRRFLQSFVAPGRELQNWTERSNVVAWGVVPTGDDEMSVYYSRHYRHPTSHLRRGVLRTDGFVSLNGPPSGGEAVTRPILFSGNTLEINYRTSAVGSVRVEVQDAAGLPIRGFSLGASDELFGDDIDRTVTWRRSSDVGALAGQPVRLRLVLKDAEIYSFRFFEGP